jgi:hypothetical protein
VLIIFVWGVAVAAEGRILALELVVGVEQVVLERQQDLP